MRLFTNLTAKILLTLVLISIISGYAITYVSLKNQKIFLDTLHKTNSEFLENTLDKVKEDILKVEQELHREMITSLSILFLRMQKHQDKKNDIQDMLDLSLHSKGMMAIKILDSDNKIILMMYKKDGTIIHSIEQIPKFISNDTSLAIKEFAISDGKINGTLVGYFNQDELISAVSDSSKISLEKFYFFIKNIISLLEEDTRENVPIYFIFVALSLAVSIFITIEIMVNSPLKKIKKGLDSFFSSLDSVRDNGIKKIKINTEDIFKDMADSLNDQISIGANLHKELDKSQKKMQDAISHSSTIQQSFIKKNALMHYFFNDLFIHWKPKDIVGGDVYFFDQINNNECIVMCIDCSGDSVHGALITVLVKAIHFQVMEDIKKGFIKQDSPSQILSYFNKRIKLILDQQNEYSNSDVGFDGGIIYYDKKNQLIKYSGAKTPLLYINDKSDEINTIKSNEYSVGYRSCDADYEYEEYTIKTHANMKFYISTDGFMDQIGGENYFKFGEKRFHEMIKSYYNKSFTEQKDFYIQQLDKYRGSLDTVDDITFIGFKV